MARWKIIAVVVVMMVAMLLVYAAPAMAATPVATPIATITVDTHATIPVGNGNPIPIIRDVWVFDGLDDDNGAVMTGSPASGGGSGQTSGGGVGGGGTVQLFGVIDPNGNNLATMEMRGWISPADPINTAVMTQLTKPEAAVWIANALAEGFINAAEANELTLQVFNSGNWGIFVVTRGLTYHDAAGGYLGNVKAIAGSAYIEATAPFTYLDVVAMDVDFPGGVNFGPVMPGATKIVTGDFDWLLNGGMPTAQNLGNVPLGLRFMYSGMTKAGGQPTDVLTNFDLEFQASTWNDAQKETWPSVNASSSVSLQQPLPLCNRAKINFSLHAPVNIQPGDYSGKFYLTFWKFGTLGS